MNVVNQEIVALMTHFHLNLHKLLPKISSFGLINFPHVPGGFDPESQGSSDPKFPRFHPKFGGAPDVIPNPGGLAPESQGVLTPISGGFKLRNLWVLTLNSHFPPKFYQFWVGVLLLAPQPCGVGKEI